MGLMKCATAHIMAALAAWLLLMPPLSVTPAGKTTVDAGAPLSNWETLSTHSSAAECAKRLDQLREQVENAAASIQPAAKGKAARNSDHGQIAFATLKERAAAARCISSTDARLRAAAPRSTPR